MFHYFVSGASAQIAHRTRNGREVLILYSPKLFQNHKRRAYSYARHVYERATGRALDYRTVVVVKNRKLFPEYEDLIALRRGATKDVSVVVALDQRDRFASD